MATGYRLGVLWNLGRLLGLTCNRLFRQMGHEETPLHRPKRPPTDAPGGGFLLSAPCGHPARVSSMKQGHRRAAGPGGGRRAVRLAIDVGRATVSHAERRGLLRASRAPVGGKAPYTP